MNDFILKRYYKLVDDKESSEKETPGPNHQDTEKEDHRMALRLQKEEGKRRVTRRATPVATKVVKRRTKTTSGTGPKNAFNADLVLSQQLQDVVGSPRMSRPQVVKQMWVYIRAHDLQNSNDKRKIDCDEKLKLLFKKNSVTMFEMNKLLSKHLFKEDELTDSSQNSIAADERIASAEPSTEPDVKLPSVSGKSSSGSGVKTEEQEFDDPSSISDVDG
ncbi:hypothetical protein JCM33374_g1479 [Metschnikowia sp. JCM 33374]|nr:hypothetical protein JCM33374_g1479 [Metschnikowia sp. JCM 33374]